MISKQNATRIFVFWTILYFFAGCSGDADKFRQAVIAGNLEIEAFFIIPDNRFINVGETLQFTATAKLKDGSSRDLTNSVSWSSSDNSIAAADSSGLLTANRDGVVVITARFADHVASVQLHVSTANLVRIEIQGPTQFDECRGIQFKAIGQYDDGSIRPDIDVIWSVSSDQSIATISNESGSKGLLKTTQSSNFNVTATRDDIAQTQAVTANKSLSAISVDPNTASIAKNDTRQFVATATYLDAGTENISSIAIWTSENVAVASVDSAGLATGIATGSTLITAGCSDVQGNTSVTVTAQVRGDTIRINDGEDITLKEDEKDEDKLKLTLTLITDDDSKDVTEDASWSVDDNVLSAITVSNAKGSKGNMTINGTGTTLVKATYEGKTARIAVTIEPK